jgi:AhpD family alkylhydroperoxidase
MSRRAQALAERAFDRMAVPRVPSEPSWVREVVDQVDREFMAGPPLTLHLPVPALFAGIWAALRESTLAGPMDRVVREAIASTVSRFNECPFCVDSHTAAVSALGADRAAKAIRSGTIDAIDREDVRAAVRWAAATRSPGHRGLAASPFTPADEPFAIGTALAFHHINRMVNTFLKPWPVKVPAFVNRRAFMTRVNGVFPGRLLGVANLESGSSLGFCAEKSDVPELAKLAPSHAVAGGWGALVAAAERAGAAVLSEECRSALADVIDAWDGSDPGLGLAWRDAAVVQLPATERPAAALALTSALASYRVDRRLVDAVRVTYPTDAAVVAMAAWASVRATRRIASWV